MNKKSRDGKTKWHLALESNDTVLRREVKKMVEYIEW